MTAHFLSLWNEAALTSLGFFWMALWAFALGYLISSLIQVLVTRQRMQRAMGTDGPRSMLLASFFGFISSSCSFAALATTRALFQKGAGLAPSLAFMLASTNLVVELGFVIAIFPVGYWRRRCSADARVTEDGVGSMLGVAR
ncbi:permease [Halomonas saccharevitans]|uniref:Predicted permease n=1 Tax=Halomonas saccharevitans TaxID=416872 RepID=A0A1I7AEM5_9GAMM|nr:permease [Halomonas saccharevitans]SFT73409.1 Predicted permease [Halomonas saccharevitans]